MTIIANKLKSSLFIVLLLLTTGGITGCWNQQELTDWGFVQVALIDQGMNNQFLLTTQVYKPSGAVGQSSQAAKGVTFINTASQSFTMNGASRDATNELGRMLQWSHMRVLLISEEILANRGIGEILDFFSRTYEVRGSVILMVTKGHAMEYLQIKPLIEGTIGQQLKSIAENVQVHSGKTIEVNLKDLSILAKEHNASFVLPYVSLIKESHDVASVFNLAVMSFPEGKIRAVIRKEQTPFLIMLMNKYKSGVLDFPCDSKEGDQRMHEAFQITKLDTQIKPSIQNQQVNIQIDVTMEGNVGELTCSKVNSEAEFNRFKTKIEENTKQHITEVMIKLQKERADLIGVSTHLHRWHNRKWKVWKQDWNERFADSDFTVAVHVELENTGGNAGIPFVVSADNP